MNYTRTDFKLYCSSQKVKAQKFINPFDDGPVGRVFANDPGDLGSIPGRVIADFKNGTWYLLA